jgi:serine/threonine-protein kinase RsbW
VNTPARAHLTVLPTLHDLGRAVQALQGLLPARLGEAERHALEIALCEVLTNIVQHGFAGTVGAPIEVSCVEHPHAFVVEVCDSGRAIPRARLEAAGADAFAFDAGNIAALPEGGFGLALVKAAFDVVDYRSDGRVNCMHLEKRLA